MRNTIAIWAMENCTQIQFKAISQSMGHEQAMTTYNAYGTLQHHNVRKAIATIGKGSPGLSHFSAKALLEELAKRS